MKKYIRLILTVCLALCTVLCLGLAVACQGNPNPGNGKDTFTIIVLNEDGTPSVGTFVQACSDEKSNEVCIPGQTNENGKAEYDLSKSPWTESESLHAQVRVAEGYSAYKEDGTLYNFDPLFGVFDDYVNHHEVKSITFIIKKDPTPIEVGYEYEDNFLGGESRKYFTAVKASEVIFEADTFNGEFELSVVVNSNVPITETLSSTKTSVTLNLGVSDTYGNELIITLTPINNAASAKIAFTLCPVYELGKDMVNARKTDVYKVYYNLPKANTEIAFSKPESADAFGGFPVTVKIGSQTATWNSENDISPITVTETGNVPFTFEFASADTANLYLLVKDANAEIEGAITLGEPIEVALSSYGDSLECTYVATEAGAYVITVALSQHATISYSVVNPATEKAVYSDPYYASENGNTLVIVVNLAEGDTLSITFGLEMPEDLVDYSETYTAVVSEKTGDVTPSNPHSED